MEIVREIKEQVVELSIVDLVVDLIWLNFDLLFVSTLMLLLISKAFFGQNSIVSFFLI